MQRQSFKQAYTHYYKSEIITKQKLNSIYKKLGVKKDKPNPWEV